MLFTFYTFICSSTYLFVYNTFYTHTYMHTGANIDHADAQGKTPLQHACEQGSSDVIVALLKLGADNMLGTCDGVLPLHTCLRNGQYYAAEGTTASLSFFSSIFIFLSALLLSGSYNVDMAVPDGDTALLFALKTLKKANLVTSLRVLCAFEPKLGTCNVGGEHPLLAAAQLHGKNDKVFGAVACIRDSSVTQEHLHAVVGDQTLLYLAYNNKCYGAVRGLLSLGADPRNAGVSSGTKRAADGPATLLSTAIREGRLDVVCKLLEYADANKCVEEVVHRPPDVQGAGKQYVMHPLFQVLRFQLDPYFVSTLLRHVMRMTSAKFIAALRVPVWQPTPDQHHMLPGSSLLLELIKRGHGKAAHLLMDFYEV